MHENQALRFEVGKATEADPADAFGRFVVRIQDPAESTFQGSLVAGLQNLDESVIEKNLDELVN